MLNNNFIQQLKKHSFSEINPQLNYLLQIKDHDLSKDFVIFCAYQRSTLFLAIFSLFMTLLLLTTETTILISTIHKLDQTFLILSILNYANVLLFLCGNWCFILIKKYFWLYNYDFCLRNLYAISLVLLVVYRITRNTQYPCQLHDFSEIYFGKNCEDSQGFLFWDSGCYLIAVPMILLLLVRESRFCMILFSFLAVLATIITYSVVNKTYCILNVITWTVVTLLLVLDIYYQIVKNYFIQRKLVETLVDNDNMEQQNQAQEMRHMIANVAHDLKTPLASFISGLDLMEHVMNECTKAYKNATLTTQGCYDRMLTLEQYLNNIRDTNSFMLMTINRCIDFTKASKGMKLIPRHETISLYDTLKLPLTLMKNIQNRIHIELKPMSDTICSHVITDKQWLQENILCLLSNAVKYSSSGEVTITVEYLENQHELNSALANNKSALKIKLVNPKKLSGRHVRVVPVTPAPISPMTGAITKRSFTFEEAFLNSHKEDHSPHPSQEINNSISINNKSLSIHSNQDKDKNKLSYREAQHDDFMEPEAGFLRFEVEDHGIGVPEEAMTNLFNPFKQTQRLAGGTGLGLYSLAKRIEALNGKYGVMRRKDGKEGSLFWFTIPYKPDTVLADMMVKDCGASSYDDNCSVPSSKDSIPYNNSANRLNLDINLHKYPTINSQLTAVTESMSLESYSVSQTSTKKLSILLVDDAPIILKMTSLMLKKLGHEIVTAENGVVAIKKIEEKWEKTRLNYDLILMDLQMPIMDGLEASRRIRELEKVPTFISPKHSCSQLQVLSSDSQHNLNKPSPKAGSASKYLSPKNSQSLILSPKPSFPNLFATSSVTSSSDMTKGEIIRRPRHVIIGCSANSDGETTEEAFKAGVDAFMAKPFTVDVFNETIKKLL